MDELNDLSVQQIMIGVVVGFAVVLLLAVTALYFGLYAHY
jgi:hypothetical protein